jgi:ABC-type branched-subunit amino acid transport system ATPase component
VSAVLVLRQAPDGVASLWSRSAERITAPFRLPRRRAEEVPAPARPRRAPATLEVSDVGVSFGGVVALDGVSFSVGPGEVVGLIGPNGAGKTTLLDVVTGFTAAARGSVRFDGAPIDGLSVERRARAGIVRSWQAVELFEEMTVKENLLVAADDQSRWQYLVGLVRPGRQKPTALMDDLVAEFGLGGVLDQRPSALPHGVSRLVGIARALVSEPAVLLLDEPAAGLDSREASELGSAIRAMAQRDGIGILVIEHDVPLLLQTCDRMVVLDFGRKIAEGSPGDIAGDTSVIEAYLGSAGTTTEQPV